MKWVGHIARMGKVRNAYKFLVGRDRLWDVDVDWRI
jgi:hypothetical protein